jgi:hypothetical protein
VSPPGPPPPHPHESLQPEHPGSICRLRRKEVFVSEPPWPGPSLCERAPPGLARVFVSEPPLAWPESL